MKKFLFLFATLWTFAVQAQIVQIGDTGTLRSYVNTNIVPNGTRSITAQILSNIFNGFLNVAPKTGGGGTGTGFSLRTVTSSNFSSSTDCPIPALNGDTLQIFWNDLNRFLIPGSEWTYKTGGGFKVTMQGFDATAASYSFSIYANNGATTPGPLTITSSNFTSATNCPLTSLNGMQLSIFWNDANRYLSSSEWAALAGGGFTVTVPGFDATSTNYTFFVFNQ